MKYREMNEAQRYLCEQAMFDEIMKQAEDCGDGFSAEMDAFLSTEDVDELLSPSDDRICDIRALLKNVLRQLDDFSVKRKWRILK